MEPGEKFTFLFSSGDKLDEKELESADVIFANIHINRIAFVACYTGIALSFSPTTKTTIFWFHHYSFPLCPKAMPLVADKIKSQMYCCVCER